MKIAYLNNPDPLPVFGGTMDPEDFGVEPDWHLTERRTVLVRDTFDFVANDAQDKSGDWLYWRDHGKRLGVEVHFVFKKILTILFLKANSNPSAPTFDNFGTLTSEEMAYVAKYPTPSVFPKAVRLTVPGHTNEIDKKNFKHLLALTKNSRTRIVEEVRESAADLWRDDQVAKADLDLLLEDALSYMDLFRDANNPLLADWFQGINQFAIGGARESERFQDKSYHSATLETTLTNSILGDWEYQTYYEGV